MSHTLDQIIGQLKIARDLAHSDPNAYPKVLRHILNFLPHQEKAVQDWCIEFLQESFVDTTGTGSGTATELLGLADKVDLAIDSLDKLIQLSNVRDLSTLRSIINISSVVYRLVFQYVAENDGCNAVWSKLTELKNSLVNKFQLNFPLLPSDNDEHDLLRNVETKLELIKFIMIVIDYQSKSTAVNGGVTPFNLGNVSPNHSLIKYTNMEYESVTLLGLLLKAFNQDVIVAPIVSATLNHFIIIMKRKPQYVTKIFTIIETYDTNKKLQSNYQTVENFKLTKKYIDRILKVFLHHLQKNNLIPSAFQSSLSKKLVNLVERGVEIRKKNIFVLVDKTIKKRKFDGFLNNSKRIKVEDATYLKLYCLNDVDDELNSFDLSTVPQHILTKMVVTALQKASISRLTKALDIISERYIKVIADAPLAKVEAAPKVDAKPEDDEDDEGQAYNPETVYTLPPPEHLSFKEKKEHIAIIIKNLFNLANAPASQESADPENTELTKIAITAWKKDSWLILLTRLATRGMRTKESEVPSPDDKNNDEMSDMIRNAIFDFFLDDIHLRVDLIIEWLNEEWYSERVYNEKNLEETKDSVKEETKDSGKEDTPIKTESSEVDIKAESTAETITSVETPIYNKWAGKVLDAMIPFLEPGDRKIFIRLLSDLPYLNADLVSRIQSLILDPLRSKIGFLSLQFLIMYRPPVKDVCLGILRELTNSDQEDLKEEATKLLAKYT